MVEKVNGTAHRERCASRPETLATRDRDRSLG